MGDIANGIMANNTLIYSIFFAVMIVGAVYFIAKFFIVNKGNLGARHWVPLALTLVTCAYSFEQISWGHFYKLLGFNMFIFYALVAYLYADKISKRKIVRVAFWFLVCSSVLMMILGCFDAFNSFVWYGGDRFCGILGNPNTLQFCVSIILAIVLTMFFCGHIGRLEMYGKVVTLVALGLLTRSKTFYVILFVCVVVYLVYEYIKHTKLALIETATLLLVIGFVALVWGQNIFEYMYNRIVLGDAESFIDGLFTHRWAMWGDYIGYWCEDIFSLFFGKGFSSPDFVIGGTHNDFIFIFYNLGTIGALLCASLATVYIVYAKDKKKKFSIWSLFPLCITIAVCCTENMIPRMFSLLIVLSCMFVFDGEYYGKKKAQLNGAKVMVITTTDNMIWQFLLPHIKDMQDMGATVECVCSKTGFWYDEMQDKYGLTLHNIHMKRNPVNFTNIIAYFKLIKLQRKQKYDIIYCQQPVGGMMGRLIGHLFNLPVVYTSHGNFFYRGNSKLKNLVYKSAEYAMSFWTDAMILINDEDYAACENWPAKHVYKINGIGVDLTKYKTPKDLDKSAFKKELGFADKDFIVTSVGELNVNKNTLKVLEAFKNIDNPNIKYLICGQGPLKEEFESKIAEYGLQDRVKMVGFRKDITNIFAISDVYIMPSIREGLSRSMMEAMSYGLPVVASAIRGNVDLICDNEGGILCETHDVLAYTNAIQTLYADKKLYKQYSARNKKYVKNFSLDVVRKQLKDVYKDCGLLGEDK